MMQVSDLSLSYLILPIEFRIDEELLFGFEKKIDQYKAIQVIKISTENAADFLTALALHPTMKVMDNFYLFDYGEETTEIHQSFFDLIASKYETLIDRRLNSELIKRYLLQINDIFQGKELINVLDLGSGTGISSTVLASSPDFSAIKLYGYEISPQMEKLSKQAGLDMLNTKMLIRHQDYFFDAVFGSYSFHFITGHSIYETIWQKLRIGGIILANFHKRIGLENALKFFQTVNADIRLVSKYANGEIYQFKKTAYPFLSLQETIACASKSAPKHIETNLLIDYLIRYSFLPAYELEGSPVFLKNDITRLKTFFKFLSSARWEYGSLELYDQIFMVDSGGIKIEFSRDNDLYHENYNPALLITLLLNNDGKADNNPPIYLPIGNSLRVTIRSAKLKRIFESSNTDKLAIESARATIFANSASYMGSKKALRHFLYSAIKCLVPQSYTAIDLMCGAGAVASILAMRYETFVSDAMSFSRILAAVQGSGFTSARAIQVQEKLRTSLRENLDHLRELYKEPLRLEDDFFHMRINSASKHSYQEFCLTDSFANPAYHARYILKQQSERSLPFELFTIAYGNIFFGIKQCVQIDSLRFAIEQLEDPLEKIWALGTLIATISATSNTYAGHFAQPKYKDTSLLSDSEFIRLIEQRSLSILSEFEARFMAFAHESQSKELSVISPIEGPWPLALDEFIARFKDQGKFVYVDAPYTRDEYSRYYHVLETLIDYQYYNLSGLANIPDKKTGSRFKSNFFTRDVGKLKREFLQLFTTVLASGGICGWSYSNSASANCLEIIYEVVSKTNCSVESFEIPYEYKGQGGNLPKQIKEYFIVFRPRSKPQNKS